MVCLNTFFYYSSLAIERTSDKKLQKIEEWENFERKELQTKEKKEKVSYASVFFQGLLLFDQSIKKLKRKGMGTYWNTIKKNVQN